MSISLVIYVNQSCSGVNGFDQYDHPHHYMKHTEYIATFQPLATYEHYT